MAPHAAGHDCERHAESAPGKGDTQQIDAGEKDAKTGQCLAQRLIAVVASVESQQHAKADERQGDKFYRSLEIDQAHQPADHGMADIAAIHKGDGLHQIHEPGIDKADGGHGHCSGGLHQGGDQDAGKNAPERGGGGASQDGAQGIARGNLEALGHELHPEQEEADSPDKTAKDGKMHVQAPFVFSLSYLVSAG